MEMGASKEGLNAGKRVEVLVFCAVWGGLYVNGLCVDFSFGFFSWKAVLSKGFCAVVKLMLYIQGRDKTRFSAKRKADILCQSQMLIHISD